jgi:hypothetical protein
MHWHAAVSFRSDSIRADMDDRFRRAKVKLTFNAWVSINAGEGLRPQAMEWTLPHLSGINVPD